MVILKTNFKPTYRPNPSLFWSGNSNLLVKLIFLAEFVKSPAFYKLLQLFQRVDMFELQIDANITMQICQLFGIATTVCKKQWF